MEDLGVIANNIIMQTTGNVDSSEPEKVKCFKCGSSASSLALVINMNIAKLAWEPQLWCKACFCLYHVGESQEHSVSKS